MARAPRPTRPTLFGRLTLGGERNFLDTLRDEKTGGLLLLVGAVVALVWANSPLRDAYATMRETVVGPAALHLDLSLSHWATDGLLAIFFFVVGLELKREIVAGELRRPATAALPIVGAVGGMAVPAAFYVALNLRAGTGDLEGWAVPTATDIAFAVAVIAVVGRSLPNALRAFLLTLAVVDDLLAIMVIAIFYSESLALGWLGASLVTAAVFAVLVRRRAPGWLLLVLAVVTWALMHASGIHATIAGVLLGLCAPAIARAGESESVAEHLEHRWRPLSAGFAVPVFALFAAGVSLDPASLAAAAGDPVAQGVVVGLVLGKPIGITVATWLMSKATRTPLGSGLGWSDVLAVGFVAGIGFTVSLLIGELAFGEGTARDDHVRAAILVASTLAAAVGASMLSWRDRHHRTPVAPVPEG